MCQLPIDAINEGTTFHPYPTEFMLSEDYMRILDQEIRKQYSFSQLETDFGTIKFASFPSMKTKNKTKKSKVKQPSVKRLQAELSEFKLSLANMRQECYDRGQEIQRLKENLNDKRTFIEVLEERDKRRLRAIGLYFATIDSEQAASPDSLEHLRNLRLDIFI